MYEVAGDGQVHVAGEIEVVDASPLEDSCLLRAHMRGEEEQPVVSVIAGQFAASAIQLLRDDGGILVAELTLHLHEVANGLVRYSPGDKAVEALQGLSRLADLGLRHPLIESRTVEIEIGSLGWPSHVRDCCMFINNEQVNIVNTCQ
jgi:hypothetical protein